ncbi:hypothetical protein EYF80_008632 [Liparis tanakae]|uniref:Uncharacterized protein n=1 Tax=Liparis tanakae TaxID=230148 RepID=A0A4Z2ISZ4_9TELE|nr:hypothetical protein EYF80_008632 [Liparis tanakae]
MYTRGTTLLHSICFYLIIFLLLHLFIFLVVIQVDFIAFGRRSGFLQIRGKPLQKGPACILIDIECTVSCPLSCLSECYASLTQAACCCFSLPLFCISLTATLCVTQGLFHFGNPFLLSNFPLFFLSPSQEI